MIHKGKVMTAQIIERISSDLKGLIDKHGLSYLEDEPYQVYRELLTARVTDQKTAAALLHVLVSGILADIQIANDPEEMSKTMRRKCSLNKTMADRLARILTSLYSSTHKKEWKRKNQSGLREFLKEEFTIAWNGFAVWDEGNGTVACHYEATIVLAPIEGVSGDKELTQRLKKNPFITKDAIREMFANRLKEYLDDEFEDYCTCEDYYQPAVEDFGYNMNCDLQKWCRDNGFKLVSVEGSGGDDGYEPKCRFVRY